MTGLVLLAALLAALAATGWRAWRRRRRRVALAALAGGSRETAIEVDAFTDIDDHLSRRECPCGGLLMSLGERSEQRQGLRGGRSAGRLAPGVREGGRPEPGSEGKRILRVMRVECRRCEDRSEVWFDATRAYH